MSFKSGVTVGRILKGGLVSLPRSGHYPCAERDSTSAPNGTVPLHRTGQYLCSERDSTSVPSEVYHHTPSEVYLPTRPSGTHTLARVVPAHSPEWAIHPRSTGTCPPQMDKLLRRNFKFFQNSK